MGSWIAKRAQADPASPGFTQALRGEGDAYWTSLLRALKQNVDEFNALYGARPERLAEYTAEETRATIRLKAKPDIYAVVSRQEARLECRFGSGQRSRLAADFRIFGDWDTVRVLAFVNNGRGTGVALPGGEAMDAGAAAEFILSPILFPPA